MESDQALDIMRELIVDEIEACTDVLLLDRVYKILLEC